MLRDVSAAAAVAALFSSAPVPAANREDAALNAVYAGLAAARAANDVAGMAGAFSSRGLLVDARAAPAICGAELADRLRPQAERVAAGGQHVDTAYRIERRSILGNVAIDAGYMRRILVRADEEPLVRYSRFLVTLLREADGAWRIAGDAAMPSTEEAWDAVPRSEGLHFDA